MSARQRARSQATRLAAHARRLDAAMRTARAVPQFTGADSFDLDGAYTIQRAAFALRLKRGERAVGMKMGFTSRAKAEQMGVHDVICGRLSDRMLVEDGGRISLPAYVHPRVEPEVAFLLARPLSGTVSPLQALDAVAAVAPALEIIDSRYENFRFSLTDVVADNSSSAAFVIGNWNRRDLDLSNLGLVLTLDGRTEATGSTAAILGHPLRSLAAAARLAQLHGIRLDAGSIVLAGGATAASPLRRGIRVCVEMEQLGRAAFTVEK